MDRQPVLEGETLRLRPLREDDREDLYRVAGDRELWALHPHHERWQRPVFDTLFNEAIAAGGALAVEDKASGEVIGSSQFRPSALDPDAMEIGWSYLARKHWGGAANREVKRLMLAHALAHKQRCLFRVGAENWRSRRAMEKIGGVLTDIREQVPFKDGRLVEHVVFAIDRAGFASGPLAG